jgi:hypothetical protein
MRDSRAGESTCSGEEKSAFGRILERVSTDLKPNVVRELVLLDETTNEGELGFTR